MSEHMHHFVNLILARVIESLIGLLLGFLLSIIGALEQTPGYKKRMMASVASYLIIATVLQGFTVGLGVFLIVTMLWLIGLAWWAARLINKHYDDEHRPDM